MKLFLDSAIIKDIDERLYTGVIEGLPLTQPLLNVVVKTLTTYMLI